MVGKSKILGTHNDKMCAEILTGNTHKIPQIPHNSFDPSSQIGQLFGIFLKTVLITCPLSMDKNLEPIKLDCSRKCKIFFPLHSSKTFIMGSKAIWSCISGDWKNYHHLLKKFKFGPGFYKLFYLWNVQNQFFIFNYFH